MNLKKMFFILLFCFVAVTGRLFSCPFCTMQGQTLVGEVNQASMVLFGTLKNAKIGNADGA
ncbi:MAG: hypothetical protein JHC56_14215, partial [Gemmataceae bacterium]|nr:hypothetical protein [Gemmataceae bacterium]